MANRDVIRAILGRETRERLRNPLGLIINYGLPILFYPVLLMIFGEAAVIRQAARKKEVSRIAIAGTPFPRLNKKLKQQHAAEIVELTPAAAQEAANLATRILFIGPRPEEDESRSPEAQLDHWLNAKGLGILVHARPRQNAPDNYEIHIFFDRSRSASTKLMQTVDEEIDELRATIRRERMRAHGLPEEFAFPIRIVDSDVAGEGTATQEAMGWLVPYLVFMFLSLATFYPALEAFAKERERGTLVALLSTPAPPGDIVLAKTLSVLMSVALSIASHVVSLFLLTLAMARMEVFHRLSLYQFNLPLVVPLIFTASAVLAAGSICAITLAKSKEEGQGILSLMMMVTLTPVLFSAAAGIKLSAGWACVPLLNVALVLKAIVRESVSPWIVGLAGGVNLAFAGAIHSFSVHLFSRETVQFRGEYALADLLSLRRDSLTETNPLLSFLVFLLLLGPSAYLGIALSGSSPLVVAPFMQLLIAGIPLAVAWYYRLSLRASFSLRVPQRRNVAAAVVLGLAAPLVMSTIIRFLPSAEGIGEELAKALGLTDESIPSGVMLLLVALLPGICEELAYRGLILGGLLKRISPFWAILVTSILFGAAHFSVVRFFPTAIIGVVLGYAAWRSESIFTSMILHALYNASFYLYARYGEPMSAWSLAGVAGLALGLALIQQPETPVKTEDLRRAA
jgi:sodium transport system permease protein